MRVLLRNSKTGLCFAGWRKWVRQSSVDRSPVTQQLLAEAGRMN
jgi:hypothetical protein